LRVRCGSVHFDARPIVGVEVIEVPIAGLLPDPGLAFRRRQAVRSLDTPDVSEFKQGKGAFGRVAERELDVAPPADPRARVQRFAYPFRGRAPASDRAADPVVCLIEASRASDEIEHRLFDPRARGREGRVPGASDRSRSMNDDTRDLPAPRRIAAMRNGDVDHRTAPVEETVQLGGTLMAENGTGTRPEQCPIEFGLARGGAAKHGVYASLQPLPSAVPQLILDCLCGYARSVSLGDTENAVLVSQDLAELSPKSD
jgi:hypothetical protein